MQKFLNYVYAPSFPSRIGRIQFIIALSIHTIISTTCIISALMSVTSFDFAAPIIIILLPFFIYFLFFKIVLVVKRLHDINSSGWWVILLPIPIINFLFYMIMFFYPGNARDNKFGSLSSKLTRIDYFIAIISIPINLVMLLFENSTFI